MSKCVSRDGYNIEIISSRKTKEVKVVNLDTGDIRILGYRPNCDKFNFYIKEDKSRFNENDYLGKTYVTIDGVTVEVIEVKYKKNGCHRVLVKNIANNDIREFSIRHLQTGKAKFYSNRDIKKVGDILNLYNHELVIRSVKQENNSHTYLAEYKGKLIHLRNENISEEVYPMQLKFIDLIGQSGYTTQGIKLTVKDYNKENKTYVLEYEDGYITEKPTRGFNANATKVGDFYVLNKNIQGFPHPYFKSKGNWGTMSVKGLAYKLQDNKDTYYYCECIRCNYRGILSPGEMLKHICWEG